MSFSGEIKEELSKHCARARHCQLAELSALIGMCGEIHREENGSFGLKIYTENISVIRKCFTLLEKTFNTELCAQKSAERQCELSAAGKRRRAAGN